VWLLKFFYYRSGNISYVETVLAPCLYALLDLALQSGDDHLHALQGCGLGGDSPSRGCLLPLERRRLGLVQETKSTHIGQHALDCARAVVGGRAAAGVLDPLAPSPLAPPALEPLLLATPSLVPPPLVPPLLGPSSRAAIAAATGADEARTAEAGYSGRCEAGGRRPAGAGEAAESVHVRAAEAFRMPVHCTAGPIKNSGSSLAAGGNSASKIRTRKMFWKCRTGREHLLLVHER
jgi:hypothetical protein